MTAMRRPQIKDVHAPYRTGEGPEEVVRIGGPVEGRARVMKGLDGQTWALIETMDGSRTTPEIIAAVRGRYPDLTEADVLLGIRSLTAGGHVEDAAAPLPDCVTGADLTRFEGLRQFCAWLDPEPRTSPWAWLQAMREAHVTVIGVGGTGSWSAEVLIRSGLGHLHLVEPDHVTEANLTRQVFYTEADAGRPKLDVALERLRAISSAAAITGEAARITGPDDILARAESSDVLVLAADEPPRDIKVWCNRACWKTGTPWVDCSYAGPQMQIRSFVPGEGACWECLVAPGLSRRPAVLASHPEDLTGRAIPPHPTSAITAGISGMYAAWHAIARITGIAALEPGRADNVSILSPAACSVSIARHQPGCPVCG
jgi:molybdopterin/thiamine biosynthesis adenylyltransferase